MIDADSNNWNRTIGLCGSLTDNIFDDFYHSQGEAVNINQFVQQFTVISSKIIIIICTYKRFKKNKSTNRATFCAIQ